MVAKQCADTRSHDIPLSEKKTSRRYVPHRLRTQDSARKRNARERRRQGRINTALDRLQSYLPETEEERREGKEQIMRRAISYIRYLRKVLGYADDTLERYRPTEMSADAETHEDYRPLQ